VGLADWESGGYTCCCQADQKITTRCGHFSSV
jgi:hypothetical protein